MDNTIVKGTKTPYSGNSTVNALDFFVATFLNNKLNTAIPVKVTAVDGQYVSAIPLVTQTNSDGEALQMVAIPKLPFFQYQAGICKVIITPVVGDIGVAVFAKQDISNVKKEVSEPQRPASFRNFDQSDGMYFGGILNKNPTCVIEMKQDNTITITASNGVTINGDVTVNGDVTADGISLKTHVHSGVETGSENTEKPV